MSLLAHVAELVAEMVGPRDSSGGVTVEDLLPHCPGYTRAQVMAALQNAAHKGLIRLVRPGQHNGHRGARPGLYGRPNPGAVAGPDPTPPRGQLGHLARVSSVWDLGRIGAR